MTVRDDSKYVWPNRDLPLWYKMDFIFMYNDLLANDKLNRVCLLVLLL